MKDYADSAVSNEKTKSNSQIDFCNCLEFVAKKQCPQIQIGLNWFQSNGLNGKMTGSGSALFAKITKTFATKEISEWTMLKCESLIEHPLKHWVN
jgi:4-diphosphocytidyl-2-C-methyl-D-erythritol kinase